MKGKSNQAFRKNLGRREFTQERERERERERTKRDDCNSEQVKKTEMGNLESSRYNYIPKDD